MSTAPVKSMSEAPSAPTDNQLVARTLGGDVAAFNDLVVRWEPSLYRFVVRYLGDPEEARDVCQEAFMRAYSNLDRFRGQAKFSSWLYQIALNQCRTQFRRRKTRPTVSLDEDEQQSHLHLVPAGGDVPETAAIKSQHATTLQAALSGLPEEQRTAIILKEYHGLKFREIAEILETPESTIKSRLYHGLESLAKSLGHLQTEGLS